MDAKAGSPCLGHDILLHVILEANMWEILKIKVLKDFVPSPFLCRICFRVSKLFFPLFS
jgi:hypothetical protein